jgi:alpha-glucosidase
MKILATLCILTSAVAHAAPQRRVFKDGNKYLIVEALRDDLVHFEVAGSGTPSADKSIYTTPMVAKTDYAGPQSFKATGDGIETAVLRVSVDAGLCVTSFDKQRNVQLNRLCPSGLDQAWKTLTVDSPATRNVYGLGQYFAAESPNGDWLGRVWDPLSDGYGARLRGFAGGANDFSMFPIAYALGQGTQGYALFVDVIYKQMWDFRASPWKVGMWGDQLRWYVIAGNDLPELRRSYIELTGRAPVPPKRSFGLWVSEFGFSNWDEIDSELASLCAKHFPVDGFALDLQWFGGSFADPDHSKMGTLSWDTHNFPDPAGKIRSYGSDQGLSLMLIEEPYIAKPLAEHDALASRGFLVRSSAGGAPTYLNYNPWWGRGGMVDFTNPAAGDFWHDFRRQTLAGMGVADHWADLGEPEQYDATSWYYGFPEINKHGHADIHNIYGFRWMESIARGYQRHPTGRRPFLLSRTGTSGIQRLGVAMWSGDTGSGWGNLRSQMNVQMHMSESGIDYYGSDVGGFQNNRDGALGQPELLYTQWFAAAAALDVPVRPHAWNLDKKRQTAPSKRGDARANLDNLRWRYELTPYYYSLAHLAARTGDPVFPPLVHYFQADDRVRTIGDEKLIGRDLLVALAADAAAVTRPVYLPAGDWFDIRAGEWVRGGLIAGVPLYDDGVYHLPFYARAGAILPAQRVDDQTWNNRGKRGDGSVDQTLVVKVFAGTGSFDLYEDDGDSTAAAVAVTHITQSSAADAATVTLGATAGSYAGMPASRPVVLEYYGRDVVATAVTLNGSAVPFRNDGARIVIDAAAVAAAGTKTFVIQLAARGARGPSGYFTCRNANPGGGVSVYAVGSDPALGAWDAGKAVKLAATAPGTWSLRVGGLGVGSGIDWKCIQKRDDGSGDITWQPGGNSHLQTASTGFSGESVGSF